jgi:HD superfamily phosphohydrolase YqeK
MGISLNSKNIKDIYDWFESYVSTFKYNNYDLQQNIDLKKEHTKRVCKEIINIGEQLSLNEKELELAGIIALLHDVGRFEQYARHKTFLDHKSENHAKLGLSILNHHGVLNSLDVNVRELIITSIRNHNLPSLPTDGSGLSMFYSKILRDADKLDIWKVVTDYYQRTNGKKNDVLTLDLPETPGFSEEIYQNIMNRSIVDIRHVKNLNDLKLLQTGWIFDINFAPTFNTIQDRQYLKKMHNVLPDSIKIIEMFEFVHSYIDDYISVESTHGQNDVLHPPVHDI